MTTIFHFLQLFFSPDLNKMFVFQVIILPRNYQWMRIDFHQNSIKVKIKLRWIYTSENFRILSMFIDIKESNLDIIFLKFFLNINELIFNRQDIGFIVFIKVNQGIPLLIFQFLSLFDGNALHFALYQGKR